MLDLKHPVEKEKMAFHSLKVLIRFCNFGSKISHNDRTKTHTVTAVRGIVSFKSQNFYIL